MQGYIYTSYPAFVRRMWGVTYTIFSHLLWDKARVTLHNKTALLFLYFSTSVSWENFLLNIFIWTLISKSVSGGTQLKTEITRNLIFFPEGSGRLKGISVIFFFYLLEFGLSPLTCLRYLDVLGKKINSFCTSRFM